MRRVMTQTFEIINADVIQWAIAQIGKIHCHCLLSDPPYHLVSIVKRFGKKNSAPAKGHDVNIRRSKGFMGQSWDGLGPDGEGIAFKASTWDTFGQILYPGAFGFAYSGSRTYHRLMVALEDAGYALPPSIFSWAYSTGFTTPTRIDRSKEIADSEAESEAESWSGYRYGTDVLKPAVEPIIAFQKPFSDRPVVDILNSGAGALWVDGGRIPFMDDETPGPDSHPLGRWPKNLILTHLPDCDIVNQTCVSGCPCKKLNGNGKYFFQANWAYEIVEKVAMGEQLVYVPKPTPKEQNLGLEDQPCRTKHRMNSGGLSDSEDRFKPKPSKNNHPTIKPILASLHFARMLLPHPRYKPRTLFVPFSGSGSEVIAGLLAGFEHVIGVEIDPVFCEIARARCEYWLERISWGHDTVEKVLETAQEIKTGKQLAMF